MLTRATIWIVILVFLLSTVFPVSIPVSAIDSTDSSTSLTNPTEHALNSGDDYWQGFRLKFDGSAIVDNPESASTNDRTFQVRAVSNGEVGDLVDEFTIDQNGTALIDTSPMAGRMVVQYKGDTVYVENSQGYLDPPDGTVASVETSSWEVTPETYAAEWSDPSVYAGELTELTLSSNRAADGTVAVSADQLSFTDLTKVFSSDAFAENFADRADEHVLILKAGATRDYEISAAGLSPGVYTLTFESTDTTARLTTTLEVKRGGKIVAVERAEQAGDLIEAAIECSDCYLVVGGADEGFVDLLDIRDGDGDGFVNLTINARYMGLQPSASSIPSDVDPYFSSTDSVDRLSASYQLTARDSKDQLGTLRTDLGLASQGRTAPVAPGPVDLTVTTSDFLMDRGTYGEHRAPLGGKLVVRDEQDVSTIDLGHPALGGIETYAQPSRFGVDRNLTDVTNRHPPTEQVAIGDELVVRVDVAGIYGYLDATGADLGAIAANSDEGISLKIGRSPGRPGLPIDIRANSMDIAEDHDRLYVAIDTSRRAIRREISIGVTYHVSFTLSGIDGSAGEYDLTGTEEQSMGYPYLSPGDTRRVETSVEFVEPSVTVTHPGDSLRLPNRNPVRIQGTSNLAPGSIIAVRAEASWSKSTSATVQPDGTWTAHFDFSNTKVGDSFTVTAKKQSQVLAQTTGTVVEPSEAPAGTTPSPPGATGPSPSTPGGTSDASSDQQGSNTDSSNESETAVPNESNQDSGGIFGSVLSGGLSGLILPIAAILGIFVLIALVVGRLR